MTYQEFYDLVGKVEKEGISFAPIKVPKKTKAKGEKVKAFGKGCFILNEERGDSGFIYTVKVPLELLKKVRSQMLAAGFVPEQFKEKSSES